MLDLARMNPNQALGQILEVMQGQLVELRRLNTQRPPDRQDDWRPYSYTISSAGNRQALQIPVEFHVTTILVAGDSAGRGTLQVGTLLIPIWVLGQVTTTINLGKDAPIIVKNDRVTWNTPSGTTAWDVTLIGLAR